MKTAFLNLSLAFLLVYTAKSQPNTLPIDAAHSVISFSVGFAGGITNIEGRFNDFSGEVGYRVPGDQSSFFANVSINVSSINTADGQRDEDLQGEGFFNTATYPSISFKSTSVSSTSDGYALNGVLEMLGTSKEISIPFAFRHTDPVVWVFGEPRIATEGKIMLSRSEYGIPKRGWDRMIPSLGSMMLNDEVAIKLVIQGVGKGLSGIIQEEIESNGVKAGIATYKRLLKENEGKDTYSFGASTLARLSIQLGRGGKNEEAIKIAEFATKEEPENFLGFYALGNAFMMSGQNKEAISSLEKALELNPKFDRAKKLLETLKSGE